MSGTGEVTAAFAGEERAFRIRLGEIRKIEAKADAGIGEILRRLARAVLVVGRLSGLEALAAGVEIHADDVRETLYQGLVGGGMAPADATKLMKIEIDDGGFKALLENAPVALAVLWGSQEAPEAPGEQTAGETETSPNP